MKVVMAIAKLHTLDLNVLLTNRTILRGIRNRCIHQRLLNLLGSGYYGNRFVPIHRDLKGHTNIGLRGLRRLGKCLQKLLHRLTHRNVVVDQTEPSVPILLTQNHSELGFIRLDDLTKKIDLSH